MRLLLLQGGEQLLPAVRDLCIEGDFQILVWIILQDSHSCPTGDPESRVEGAFDAFPKEEYKYKKKKI